MSNTSGHKRIAGFDGLRALAVMMVFVTHKTPLGPIGFGGYGVHLFFVLSGFLIIGILHRQRGSMDSGHTTFLVELKRFYANRLYRIWPVYYLAVAVLILFGGIGIWEQLSGEQILAMITFTTNYFQGHVWQEYPARWGGFWSLAVEEQFYLWAAPVFLLSRRSRYRTICLSVILVSLFCLLTRDLFGFPPRSSYVGSLTNFGLMALGGLFALSGPQHRILNKWGPAALAIYLLLPIVSWLIGKTSLPSQFFFWGSALLAGVVLKSISTNQDTWLVRALDIKPMRWLGRISYGFYVYHGLINLGDLSGTAHIPTFVAFPIELAATLLLSTVSWRYLEQPILALRDRRRGVIPRIRRCPR